MTVPDLDLLVEPQRSRAILSRMREYVTEAHADFAYFVAKVEAGEPLI
jgi:hypothetical protein